MSEANGAALPQPPGPVVLVAGHLVIYDDTAAGNGYALSFRADHAPEGAEPVSPPIPAFVLPLMAKVLAGESISSDDIPGGLGTVARLRAMIGGGPRG